MLQQFRIAGSAGYLPMTQVSAEEIDVRAGLPSGWTRKNAGVMTRHECRAPETLGSMAEEVVRRTLERAGVGWDGVDLLIDASTSRVQPVPCNAALVLSRFGAEAAGTPGFDVGGTCLSFVLAMHVANGLLGSAHYRRILIVSSEAALAGLNWSEPESATIMGDGAAAVLLEKAEPLEGYHFAHETYSEHAGLCTVRGGGHGLPPHDYRPEIDAEYRFHMDGPGVFRVARKLLPPMVNVLLAGSGVDRERLHVVPHQASPASLRLVRRLFGFDRERYHGGMEEHGNLVAAGIPYVLNRCLGDGVLQAKMPVMLLGTSAGYSQAALMFQI